MKKYGDLGPGVVVYALVLALGQQGQANLHELTTRMIVMGSSRLARTAQQDPILKN